MKKTSPLVLACLLASLSAQAQSAELASSDDDASAHDHGDSKSLLIEPFAHLSTVMGYTDLEHSGLERGGHDPATTGFNLTGFSLGADILYGEHFSAYAEGIATWNEADGWTTELEEAYAKLVRLPGEFELKAGRILATAGTQNHLHSHAWEFVDAHLSTVRFLGDDGLGIDGAEATWYVPTHWNDRLIVSYGNAVKRDHSEEEQGLGDGHDHSEEAEMALWNKNVFSARYEAAFWPADTCRFVYGASYVQGENFFDLQSRLYGMDLTYTWLQDEDHGQSLIWRNEAMIRDVDTDEGSFHELAISSTGLWKFTQDWEAGLRYDYLQGVEDPELPERHRISPALAHYYTLGKTNGLVRLQYNYDHSEERGNDHSIWLQLAFEWGAGDSHVH